ncbi:ATP-binding protein [Georgenia sp. M64]|uniref:sensor histidine kinase n=1 Tax=Georgenia sp. M64 TaxID=3120520 RepID=UPI0030DFAB9B
MTGPGDRRAVRETVRLLAVLVGAGGLAFSLTSVPLLRGQTTTTPSWWTVSTITALLGMLVLLVLAGALPRVSTATLRRLAGTFAVLFLLVLASYPLVLIEPVPDGQAPWMRGFVGAAAAAGATAWRASAALANIVAGTLLWGLSRWWALGAERPLLAVQDAAVSLAFGVTLAVIIWVLLRSARAVDDVAAGSAANAVREAQVASREAERAWVAAFAHDGVLATIRSASQGGPEAAPAVRREARQALDDLDELRQPAADDGELPAALLVERLRLRAELAGEGTSVEATVTREGAIPEPVAVKVVAAAAEALRNSARHAPGATRRVVVRAGASGLEVRVADDGPGFDPADVPADRLGLTRSILERMNTLPGGHARVESAPGHGTVVTLGWRG